MLSVQVSGLLYLSPNVKCYYDYAHVINTFQILQHVLYIAKELRFIYYIVWIICILVLTKQGLINIYFVLLISNLNLFSNVLKAIRCIILYRNQLK